MSLLTTPFLTRMGVEVESVPKEASPGERRFIRFRASSVDDAASMGLALCEADVKFQAIGSGFTLDSDVTELATAIPCESKTPHRFNTYAKLDTDFLEPLFSVPVSTGVKFQVNEGWRNAAYECRFDNLGGHGRYEFFVGPSVAVPEILIGTLTRVLTNDRIHVAFFNRQTNPCKHP